MPNKGLDVVQVKLVMDKTLYSEEQLSSPDQVVQFMRKELSEYFHRDLAEPLGFVVHFFGFLLICLINL